MNFLIKLFFTIFLLYNISASAIQIPEKNKVKYDIIRKNKIIGSHVIEFTKKENELIIQTNININVKILFFPAYKFFHKSKEIWKNGNFINIDAYTDFEDEREYFIKGVDKDNLFIASGMDGALKLNKNILPSNFWNINLLKEKEIFDTQKGIVRKIEVEDLGFEEIEINGKKIKCKKFTFNASSNPKDKGPFPEYTLWYSNNNNELIKFKFKNWKDKKMVTISRNYQEEN